MRSFFQTVKLGSRDVWTHVLAFGVGIIALSGCVIVDSSSSSSSSSSSNTSTSGAGGNPTTDKPMLVDIDTDIALDAKQGDGVGVFVEYQAGGRYRIWTTCDTSHSGATCPFDIYTTVDSQSKIIGTTQENLESYDSVTVDQNQGTVDLHFETDGDYDATTIDVTPGAVLRVETYIDGQSQPRFVYWFGDGILHEGAPTNPLDFSPTKP